MPNLDKGKQARSVPSEVDRIAGQVRHNCDVSDAKNAGLYSICGLALRLRDLFKWEMGLPPWEEKDSPEILDWIGGREQRWEKLADDHFSCISIQGRDFEPFDTTAINALLEPTGFYYGAGYAHGLKPTFFLARLEKKELIDGTAVVILGKELARDLLTIPALCQDHRVLLRQDSARLHLWDKMFYLKKSARPALQFALASCGLETEGGDGLRQKLEAVSDVYRDNYIYHEIGEMRDKVFDRQEWREMVADYSQSPVELLVRSIKDLLADTNEHGTLQHIVAERNAAAFGLYTAFIDGLAKEIFSELTPAFQKFASSGDWQAVRSAVESGYSKARRISKHIIRLHREGKKKNDTRRTRCVIEQQILANIIKHS
jgi:hypothetical protein